VAKKKYFKSGVPQEGRLKLAQFLRKAGRGVLKSLLVFLALLLLLVVGARFLVTPEMLKARIQSQMEKTMGLRVEIGHVTLLPLQGFKVSRFVIYESEEFGGGESMSSEFFIAKYKFSSLLRGRIELREVLLMEPHINVIRNSDGAWNVEGMQFDNGGGGMFSLPPLHSAESIRIKRGSLTVRDAKAKRRMRVDDFDFAARGFNFSDAFPVETDFTTEVRTGGLRYRMGVGFKGKVNLGKFVADDFSFEADRLKVVIDGHKLSATGTMRDLDSPELDLSLKMPALTSEIARRYLPDAVPIPDGVSLPASTWDVRLQTPIEAQNSTATLAAFDVRMLKLRTKGLDATMKGRIGLAGAPTWMTINIPKVELDHAVEYYADWKTRQISGRGTAWLKLAGVGKKIHVNEGVFKLRDFSINLGKGRSISKANISLRSFNRWKTIAVSAMKGGFTAYSNALTDINLDARYTDGDIEFKKLHFTWNESRSELAGCIEGVKTWDKVRVDGVIDRLKVDEFYATVENIIAQRRAEKGLKKDSDRGWANVFRLAIPEGFPDLLGRLHFREAKSPNFHSDNLKLLFDLTELSPGLTRADGNFEVSFGPGRVTHVPKVREANGLLNVLILPFSFMHSLLSKSEGSFNTAVLKTLDINRTIGNFSVQDGVVGVRYINFDSPQFLAFAEGDADFPLEQTRLNVYMRAQRKRGTLPDRLVDTRGRPSLRLKVTDDLNEPTPEISLRKMRADDIEEKIAAGAKRGRPLANLATKLECRGKP
jgi:hypothetical protein